jgi:acetolactate synthase-1/2/3 large subunit
MTVKVYERILQLFEAEGIKTLFGIPDPNFVHMFVEAEKRGWKVVTPHHELSRRLHGRRLSRMTGTPACALHAGAGHRQPAGAMMCAKVENSPVIFLGGQRARVTEQRVRRGRIQFVKQRPLFENSVKYSASIEYADQTDEIIRQALRVCQSGTPGPGLYRVSLARDSGRAGRAGAAAAGSLSPGEAGRRRQHGGEGRELIKAAKNPILLVGHGVHCSRGSERSRRSPI